MQSLEKIPAFAKRASISVAQAYREIKAGRLGPIVKVGKRASAIPMDSGDAWISARIGYGYAWKGTKSRNRV
jgi:predicted DNA-binding transcriptional regulator AlpA